MKRAVFFAILAVLLLIIFDSFTASKIVAAERREPLTIRRVELDSKTFNPSKGQRITLSFEITKQADVQIAIYDFLGEKVKSFDRPDTQAGRCSIIWDGREDNGKLAAGNVFLYVIEASDDLGKTVYNPAKETGGLLVNAHEFTFDKKTGEIEYVLPKSCMIRLRAGLNNGMLAQTIFDWQPRTAGRHTYKWDGKDDSGMINLSSHPEMELNLTCYTLPSNTIISTGQTAPFESKNKHNKRAGNESNNPWARKGKYVHYTHDPRNCHEPRFTVSFPSGEKTDEEGTVVVSGVTQVRVELNQSDTEHLINKRFEIMLYVDGIYIFEMEEGSSPFTFDWNTKGLVRGPHILTVNVMSYDGHIGVVSRRAIIGE